MSLLNLFSLKKSPTLIEPEEIELYLNELESNAYKSPEEMTEKEKERVSRIYSVIYPSLYEVSAQRQDTHRIFLIMYAFIFSVFGYCIVTNHPAWVPLSSYKKIIILALIDSMFLCLTYIWGRMLRSYANLNHTLMMITHSLEKYLPVHALEYSFLLTKKMNGSTHLSEDSTSLPKLLTLLVLVSSLVVLFF